MYTGYWIKDNHILGPKESGKFRIDDGYIKGPYNSKKFWIYDGDIFGPSENLPWMELNEPRNTHHVAPNHQGGWIG